MHKCIKESLGDTHFLIDISHAQLWKFEMIMMIDLKIIH
jgi:hypothetical protein